jgi:hypothetical protein
VDGRRIDDAGLADIGDDDVPSGAASVGELIAPGVATGTDSPGPST